MDFRVGDLVRIVMECDACDERRVGKGRCRFIGRVGRIHHTWKIDPFCIVDFIDGHEDAHCFVSFAQSALEHWNGLETVFEMVP